MTRVASFKGPIDDAEEWELISGDEWWHISYGAVSWETSEPRPECLLSRIRRRKPAIYRDSDHSSDTCLAASGPFAGGIGAGESGAPIADLELNTALVGVRLAQDTLRIYESVVGFEGVADGTQLFKYSLDDLRPRPRPMSGYGLDTDALRERWVHETETLVGGILDVSTETMLEVSEDEADAVLEQSTFSSLWDLEIVPPPATPARSRTPNSMTSSLDFTDSDVSEPLPSTPKTRHSSLESQGGDLTSSASKRLNASATSFVPSGSSSSFGHHVYDDPLSPSWPTVASPSPDFQFPSLPPPAIPSASLPSRLQKDEQGFYTEVFVHDISRRQMSTPNLPTFLLNERRDSPTPVRKVSKTREIIDQMKNGSTSAKASTSAQRLRRPKSTSPHNDGLLEDQADADHDHDGWICTDGQVDNVVQDRVKRGKELVAVLGTREAPKSPGSVPKQPAKIQDKGPSVGTSARGPSQPVTSSTRSPRRSTSSSSGNGQSRTPLHTSEDGWIEGPAPPSPTPRARSKSNHRQHARNRSSATSMSTLSTPPAPPTPSVFPVPVPVYLPPPVPAFGYPPPPAQAYLQFQQQQYLQMQMQAGMVYPVPYHTPVPAPFPYQPVPPVLGQYGEAPLTSKVITGAAGMRHTAW